MATGLFELRKDPITGWWVATMADRAGFEFDTEPAVGNSIKSGSLRPTRDVDVRQRQCDRGAVGKPCSCCRATAADTASTTSLTVVAADPAAGRLRWRRRQGGNHWPVSWCQH